MPSSNQKSKPSLTRSKVKTKSTLGKKDVKEGTRQRLIVGKVIAAKSPKTVTVVYDRIFIHPLYHKHQHKTTKLLVHDEIGVTVGQNVTIAKSRPYSKRKHFVITGVV